MSKRLTGISLILMLVVCTTQSVLAYSYNWWFNPASSLEVYYRVNLGPWQGPKLMSKIQPTEHYNWTIDLKSMSGAASGDTLHFYIAAIANITATYKWGLWPQYYSQPPRTPAEFQNDGKVPMYFIRTIR